MVTDERLRLIRTPFEKGSSKYLSGQPLGRTMPILIEGFHTLQAENAFSFVDRLRGSAILWKKRVREPVSQRIKLPDIAGNCLWHGPDRVEEPELLIQAERL